MPEATQGWEGRSYYKTICWRPNTRLSMADTVPSPALRVHIQPARRVSRRPSLGLSPRRESIMPSYAEYLKVNQLLALQCPLSE